MDAKPKLYQVKEGWGASGGWWAVHGKTREDALRRYDEAQALHQVINARIKAKRLKEERP